MPDFYPRAIYYCGCIELQPGYPNECEVHGDVMIWEEDPDESPIGHEDLEAILSRTEEPLNRTLNRKRVKLSKQIVNRIL